MGVPATAWARELKKKAFLGLFQLAVVLALLLFLPAGTWAYVHGWIFLAVFVSGASAITVFLVRNDPKLLERRLKAGPRAEPRRRQRILQAFASFAFFAVFVVSAVDHRFSWSTVPVSVVVFGHALVVLGFVLIFFVFRENSFASAVIEVHAGQRVIDTGPYAWVRHPMYAGALVQLAGIPLALGSFRGLWALVPILAALVGRLLDEEKVLSQELPGYEAYRRKVRYRLVPGVW